MNNPDDHEAELLALADRIDHEQLWRHAGLDRDKFTQEQRDRLDAGVNLRRYASKYGTVVKALKEGNQYIRGFKLERADNFSTLRRGCGTNDWHAAINTESERRRKAKEPYPGMMYDAKRISDEVPRMILLFERERTTGMPDKYKMCAFEAEATPLPDNHLRCALGQECRKCPHLAAIDRFPTMTPEAKDEAKAWTCATHFLLESKPDVYFETILRDKSDDAFDDRMARSFMDTP